jgi:hypothetical protein
MGYKLLIVLIWLAVPVAGYFLARQDYDNYLSASRIQRADCEARVEVLRRYSRLMSMRASQIPGIVDADTRAAWQQQWNIVRRSMEDEQRGLRQDDPIHFPQTDAQLLALEQQLTSQEGAIERAARERDAYIKAGGGLEELAIELERAYGVAEYYRSIGAIGIYQLIRDDIRNWESDYERRLRERNQRARATDDALQEAGRLRDDIQRGVGGINDYLDADQQLTYQAELQVRLARFDLRAALEELIGLDRS